MWSFEIALKWPCYQGINILSIHLSNRRGVDDDGSQNNFHVVFVIVFSQKLIEAKHNCAKHGNNKSCWAYLSSQTFLLTCGPMLHLDYFWTHTFTVRDINSYIIPFQCPCMNNDCSDGLPWRLGCTWKRSYCCFLRGYGRFGGEHTPSSSDWRGKGMLVCKRSLNLIYEREIFASL